MLDKELSGRELEVEVARCLFGFRWFHCAGANGVERNQFLSPETAQTWRELNWALTEIDGPRDDQFNDDTAAPKFARSIEAAMQVVEKFIDMGGRVSMRGMRFITEGMADEYKPGWRVNFYRFQRDVPPGTRFSFDTESESLPEAICRAALAAIESKDE